MLTVTGIGRVTKDVELKKTSTGKSVAEFDIAFPNKKNDDASFVKVQLYEKYAESLAQYLTKGKRVYVQGELEINSFEKKDGTKGKEVVMVSPQLEFLDKKAENTQDASSELQEEQQVKTTTRSK